MAALAEVFWVGDLVGVTGLAEVLRICVLAGVAASAEVFRVGDLAGVAGRRGFADRALAGVAGRRWFCESGFWQGSQVGEVLRVWVTSGFWGSVPGNVRRMCWAKVRGKC